MNGRYSRNMPALSAEECAVLGQKHVCVVGCGGLGGFLIEILARIGVGAMTVVDGDVFDVTNLNRQLLCEETLLGTKKAEAAAARVSKINSDVKIKAVTEFLTMENGSQLLEDCDLVIDALDNIDSRRILADVCAKKDLFLVHGAIGGWFAQITVVAPGSGVLDKLYPPKAQVPNKGNPSFTPAVCASIQATEAVKLLCGKPSTLLDKLLLIDLRTLEFTKINL